MRWFGGDLYLIEHLSSNGEKLRLILSRTTILVQRNEISAFMEIVTTSESLSPASDHIS
jgi:hypothetical protein